MESVERTVSGPAQSFVSTDEAAKWLGVSTKLFQDVMAHHQVQASKALKGKHLWHWKVVVLAEYLIDRYSGVDE